MASMVKFRTLATDGAELNIYASVDDINSHNVCRRTDYSANTRDQTSQHRGSENVRKRSYRSVSVCLVLLCVLLLTAVIVLCVLINTNNQQFNKRKEIDRLLTEYTNIREERDQLLTKYTNITEERDQLLTKYTNITEERDQLLTKYTNITEERDQLLNKYTNITNGREEILLRLKNLTTENERLLTNLNNQTEQLTQQKNTMMGILKADGWKEYQSSLYFISSEKKTWTESRRYCIERGADLVIINNRGEQDFIRTISSLEYFWIGLTDIAVEGRWKWVDGSALISVISGFWAYREPNGYRRENCVLSYSSGWYDFSCSAAQKWICEKNILK